MDLSNATLSQLFAAASEIDSPYQQDKTTSYVLPSENLSNCIPDTAENLVYDRSEYSQCDSRIFESVLFEVLKDRVRELIEDFSTNPHRYLSPQQQQQLDKIAYLDTLDY